MSIKDKQIINLKRKDAIPQAIKGGCPAGVFEWIDGGAMAIKAGLEEVKEALASAAVKPKKHSATSETIHVLEHVNSGEWIIANCGIFPLGSPASVISKMLKTQVVHLVYDSNSGFVGYDIYSQGRLVESFEICEAFPGCSYEDIFGKAPGKIKPSEKNLCKIHIVSRSDGEDFVTFESTLIKSDEKQVAKMQKFIDQRFKDLGIGLPSKC